MPLKQASILATIVILLVIGATACGSVSTPTRQFSSPTSMLSELPFEQLRNMALILSYDDLFRYNEDHVGELVSYQGQVIQVLERDRDRYQLRANVTQGEHSWDDAVFLRYSGPRLLEDDIIEFIGRVNGLITYDS